MTTNNEKWNGKEYDATKFDNTLGNRLEDLEVGDVAISWETKKDVISKFNFIVTKNRKTGETEVSFSSRNNMHIWSKDDPKLDELQKLFDKMGEVMGVKPINVSNNLIIQ